MNSNTLDVFYGSDGLPYKDQNRAVHFPIVGNDFQGSSGYTRIRFFYERICGDETTLVAVSKLPNGKVGSKVLSEIGTDATYGEKYALMSISGYYTQASGDLFISLQGYEKGVYIVYDDVDEIYEIKGTPTIRATGSIKIIINRATQLVGNGEVSNITLQQVLSLVASKPDSIDIVTIVSDIEQADISSFEVGQIFYSLADKIYYIKTDSGYAKVNGTGTLTPTLSLVRVQGNNSYDMVWGETNFENKCFLYNLNGVDYVVSVSRADSLYDISALDIKGMAFYKASFITGDTLLSSVIGNTDNRIDLGTLPQNVGGLAEPYYPTRTYLKGEVVIYEGVFYRCTGMTFGAWDNTKWTQLTFGYILQEISVDDVLDENSDRAISNRAVTIALNTKADKTTEINGHSLASDIDLDASDIGFETITNNEIDALFEGQTQNSVE